MVETKDIPKMENKTVKGKSDLLNDFFFLGSIGTFLFIFSVVFIGAIDVKYNLESSNQSMIGNLSMAGEIVVNKFYGIGVLHPNFWYWFYIFITILFAYYLIVLIKDLIKPGYIKIKEFYNARLERQRRK